MNLNVARIDPLELELKGYEYPEHTQTPDRAVKQLLILISTAGNYFT